MPFYKNDFASDKSRDGFHDLDNTHIALTITPAGIDYAIDIERKRVQYPTNWIAIIFAGLTVLLTGISLYKTFTSNSNMDKRQQILQTKMKVLESKMQIPQSAINYLIKLSIADSLKNVLLLNKFKDTIISKQNSKK